MAFLLASDGRNEDVSGSFRRYRTYLDGVRNEFPASAYGIATSDWYYDATDPRCPHDAWLESCVLNEISSGQREEVRTLSLSVRLLGAYHDRYIELRYPRVFSYSMSISRGEHGQRDWRYDEFRLSKRGNLVHEIEWCGSQETGSWIIEASDVGIDWVLKPISV